MVRTQIYLTENQHKRIKDLLKEEHSTMASYVRDAINEKLEKKMPINTKKKKELTFADEFRESIKRFSFNGPSDLASNVDKYVYDL